MQRTGDAAVLDAGDHADVVHAQVEIDVQAELDLETTADV